MDKKITIIDVAQLAGVSKGTVDRVVHNRGEVSKKSAEKVRKAIEQLHYEPNLYASLLASKKEHVVALLLPKPAEGEYWALIRQGFLKGGDDVASLNVLTRVFEYDQYSQDSFRAACAELLESSPSGVVLPPLFKNDTLSFTRELSSRGIPYVYVDTRLEDDGYFAYFGMPMYKSGYLCAELLTHRRRVEEVDRVVVVRIIRDKARQSDPTLSRREGFTDYMLEHFPDCVIDSVFIDPNDSAGIYKVLEEYFAAHPDVKYVVMFNSRVHLLSEYLMANQDPVRCVIGFDDLERNLEALQSGEVSFLVAQHTESQTRLAVSALADRILVGKQPERKDNYMHMDILTRLNLENY